MNVLEHKTTLTINFLDVLKHTTLNINFVDVLKHETTLNINCVDVMKHKTILNITNYITVVMAVLLYHADMTSIRILLRKNCIGLAMSQE